MTAYSVRGAARRVKRTRTTVQNWMREGMPHRRLGTQSVEIEEDVLTEWLRRKIVANPCRPGALNYNAHQEPVTDPVTVFHAA